MFKENFPKFEIYSISFLSLSIFLTIVLLSAPIESIGQTPSPTPFKIGDLEGQSIRTPGDRGRWERWLNPNTLSFFKIGNDGSVTVGMGHSYPERVNVFTGRISARFEGKFDSNGFDVFYECKEMGCLQRKYWKPPYSKTLIKKKGTFSATFRYHIKLLSKSLILVTAYSPKINIEAGEFVRVDQDAIVTKFYLTRGDTCASSADTVRSEIIKREFSDRIVLALGNPKPLSKGSVVAERGIIKSREIFKTSKPLCYTFIDIFPTAMYAHPVIHVLSDPKTGKIVQLERSFATPLITDPAKNKGVETAYYETIEDRLATPDRIFPKDEKDFKRPAIEASFRSSFGEDRYSMDFVVTRRPKIADNPFREISLEAKAEFQQPGCKKTRKVALLVDGGKDTVFVRDGGRIIKLFLSLGFNKVIWKAWRTDSLANVRSSIKSLKDELGNCDVFVVYVRAHSLAYEKDPHALETSNGYSTDGEISYGHGFTYQNKGYSYHPWNLSNLKVNPTLAKAGLDTGPGLLYSLRGIGAGYIQIILEMCNSGLLIDAAEGKKFPKKFGPPISGFFRKNQKLEIFTAAARNELAIYSNVPESLWDHLAFRVKGKNPKHFGGAFTRLFTRNFPNHPDENLDGVVSRDEYRNATKLAITATNRLITGQTPQTSGEIQGTAP